MTVELVLAGALVGLGIGYLLGKYRKPGKKPENKSLNVSEAIKKPTAVPKDIEQRAQALIDDGHKIGALKELRDSADLELKEAKVVIDSMTPSVPIDKNVDKIAQVRNLIRSGNKNEALELYRESSGVSLKEAKETIDKMEKEFG